MRKISMKSTLPHVIVRPLTGFTLVESLVALAVAAILLMGAVPAMLQLLASNRIATEVNSLTAHLQLARSEAIKQRHRAVLCPSADGRRCLGSRDWDRGYMVFVDQDADRRRDRDETVLRFRALAEGDIRLDAGRRKSLAYQPTGLAPGSNVTFTICDPGDRVAPRAVVVSNTGRPRVATTHPGGGELSCS